MEVINFAFRRDPIFDTKEIDKAPTSLEYDSMFKSLEPLDSDFGKAQLVECNISFSLFRIGLHLESLSGDSLSPGHMMSSNYEPFPPLEYSIKENPSIDYTFPAWTHPQDFDYSIVSPLQCNHHVQPTCVSLSRRPPFPTNHNSMKAISHDINNKENEGSDMPEVVIHQKFMSLVVDISIFWLQEKISWTRLHHFLTSSHIIIHVWASYFPTSCS